MIEYITSFGITLEGNWKGEYLSNLWETLFKHIGYLDLKSWLGGQRVTFKIGGEPKCSKGRDCYSGLTEGPRVTFLHKGNAVNSVINMLHETGHLIDNLWNDYFTKELRKVEFTLNGAYFAGWNGTSYISLPRANVYSSALLSSQVGGGSAWQQLSAEAYNYTCEDENGSTYVCWPECEDWADIFANGVVVNNGIKGNINQSSDLGKQIFAFYKRMESHVIGIGR